MAGPVSRLLCDDPDQAPKPGQGVDPLPVGATCQICPTLLDEQQRRLNNFYCSNACSQQAKRQALLRPYLGRKCARKGCPNHLEPRNGEAVGVFKKRLTCSLECQWARQRREPETRYCQRKACGKPLERWRSPTNGGLESSTAYSNRLYCDETCKTLDPHWHQQLLSKSKSRSAESKAKQSAMRKRRRAIYIFPQACFTDAEVEEIRWQFTDGNSTTEIAEQRCVDRTTISLIVKGKSYRHVGGPIVKSIRHRQAT